MQVIWTENIQVEGQLMIQLSKFELQNLWGRNDKKMD
jgi:hypothetical protein